MIALFLILLCLIIAGVIIKFSNNEDVVLGTCIITGIVLCGTIMFAAVFTNALVHEANTIYAKIKFLEPTHIKDVRLQEAQSQFDIARADIERKAGEKSNLDDLANQIIKLRTETFNTQIYNLNVELHALKHDAFVGLFVSMLIREPIFIKNDIYYAKGVDNNVIKEN